MRATCSPIVRTNATGSRRAPSSHPTAAILAVTVLDEHGSIFAGIEVAVAREEGALTYFLTFQGTLLCTALDAGVLALVQRPIADLGNDAQPVALDLPAEQLRPGFDQFLTNAPPDLDQTVAFGPFGTVQLGRARDQRCITLTWQGQLLSAFADGRIVTGADLPDWEGFLPISPAELDLLRQILANDWIIRSSGALVRSDAVALQHWYTLRIGDLKLDLRDQLPFDAVHWPFRLTVLQDGWRIEQLCLYRPLVYFTVFKDPTVLRQFYLSICSLLELGRYCGRILLITDRPRDEILANLPSSVAGQLDLVHLAPHDQAGFVAARFKILDLDWATRFQPVMYIDADVVCDTAIEPMLCAVARSDQLSAPLEPFSPMRSAPCAGSGLIQLEGLSPGFAVGCNFGTVGIPNLQVHAVTLRLIRTIMMTHAALHGRTALGWLEQEVANYVSFRLTPFGPAVNPFVRYGGWPNTEPSTDSRVGLVHFWPALDAQAKLAAMQRYRQRVDAAVAVSG